MTQLPPKGPSVDYRYVLNSKIGQGGMGAVYRAIDRMTGETVALKQTLDMNEKLQPPTDGDKSRFSETLRINLTNEFRTLASIRHPHIIKVLDYGFVEENRPYFTMEYLEDSRPITEGIPSLSVSEKVNRLIQTLEAVAYLHQRGMLHRDLKPENILVTNGTVKVLDFGLTILKKHTEDFDVAGTVAYMPPEAFITGLMTESADLWAIGIIAFQMFNGGEHPFGSRYSTSHEIVMRIMRADPAVVDLDISPGLRDIIQRLLKKEPEDRYTDAHHVIDALNDLLDVPQDTHTLAIRKSYLHTAPFIGRDDILQELLDLLLKAESGSGQLHFVAGVSGIGKSRLVDELRIRALVRGFVVTIGQALNEATRSYGVWQSVICRLALMVNLEDSQISVLTAIAPNLPSILGRNVEPVPDMLKAAHAQNRLFDVVEHMLRSIPQPTLILLEDLQWADEGSLALLKYLQRFLDDRSILVIGTYRTDVDTTWTKTFNTIETSILNNLTDNQIQALVRHILGVTADRANVIDFLKRTSEGNAFFLIETINALAEQTGKLSLIGSEKLPEDLFPVGIRAIVADRLSRLDAEMIPFLHLAASAGRELDINLLGTMRPDIDLDVWLMTYANNAILEVVDDVWRFTHGKIRDELINRLTKDDFKTLHRELAQAKVDEYGAGSGHEASIAGHWESADDKKQAGDWYFRAGQVAELAFDTPTALLYYQKALEYLDRQTSDIQVFIAIHHSVGKLNLWQAKFDVAHENFANMQALAEEINDELGILRARLGICGVERDSGNADKTVAIARTTVDRAEAIGEAAQPELVEALGFLAWGLYRKQDFRAALAPAEQAQSLARSLNLIQQLARIQGTLGIIYLELEDMPASEKAMLDALKTAHQLGERRSIAIATQNLAEFYRLTGELEKAEAEHQNALKIHTDISAQDGILIVKINLGMVYIGMKAYDKAIAILTEVVDVVAADNYTFWVSHEALEQLIIALEAHGDYEQANEFLQEWVTLAKERKNELYMGQAWAMAGTLSFKRGTSFYLDGETYTASMCYQESIKALQNMDKQKVRVLEEWANWELQTENFKEAVRVRDMAIVLMKRLDMLTAIKAIKVKIPDEPPPKSDN